LQRITLTGIISKGAFYSKEKKKWMEDTFHLYERLISKGEKLLSGEVADTNYLYLNSWYLDNINANYVKPIDWEYYNSLKTPLAQRLYELLSVKFYGVIMRKDKYFSYRYSTLCDLLPASRQKYFSWAKRILDPAHKKLKETGFLMDYCWNETSPKTKCDWLITYYVGNRAREEVSKSKVYFKSPEFEVDALPEPEPEIEVESEAELEPELEVEEEPEEPLTPEQVELAGKLVELNVSKIVASDLVRYSDLEFIREWTEAIHYTDAKDKAAYLVKAIREDWLLPEKYFTRKEQEKKKAEMEKLKSLEDERKKEEERKRKEEVFRLEAIYHSLSPDQKEAVDNEAEARISFIARDFLREGRSDSPVVKAERKAKREEVLTEWLNQGKLSHIGEQK